MSGLKIKTESLPARCEICHQNDLFDPINNSCSRCNQVVIQPIKSTNSIFRQSVSIPETVINILENANIFLSLLAGVSLFWVFVYKFINNIMDLRYTSLPWNNIVLGILICVFITVIFFVVGSMVIGFTSIVYPVVVNLLRSIKWCWYKLRAAHQ